MQEMTTAKNRFLGNAVMSGGSGPMSPTKGLSTSPAHAVQCGGTWMWLLINFALRRQQAGKLGSSCVVGQADRVA